MVYTIVLVLIIALNPVDTRSFSIPIKDLDTCKEVGQYYVDYYENDSGNIGSTFACIQFAIPIDKKA